MLTRTQHEPKHFKKSPLLAQLTASHSQELEWGTGLSTYGNEQTNRCISAREGAFAVALPAQLANFKLARFLHYLGLRQKNTFVTNQLIALRQPRLHFASATAFVRKPETGATGDREMLRRESFSRQISGNQPQTDSYFDQPASRPGSNELALSLCAVRASPAQIAGVALPFPVVRCVHDRANLGVESKCICSSS